jgi:hypothetical protein
MYSVFSVFISTQNTYLQLTGFFLFFCGIYALIQYTNIVSIDQLFFSIQSQ